MTTRLQVAKLCLGAAVLKYKQHRTMPTTGDARALLAELGVNGAERVARRPQVTRPEQLENQVPGTVIIDSEDRVLEFINGEWLMTGEEVPPEIDLPARVLYTPGDDA